MQKRQVFEAAPPPPPVVTEYQVLAKQCPACGETSVGLASAGVTGQVQYGPRGPLTGDAQRDGGRSSTCFLVMLSRIPSSIAVTALIGMATSLRPHFRPHTCPSSSSSMGHPLVGRIDDESQHLPDFAVGGMDRLAGNQLCLRRVDFLRGLELLEFREGTAQADVAGRHVDQLDRDESVGLPPVRRLDDKMRDLTGGRIGNYAAQLAAVTIRALRPNPDRELSGHCCLPFRCRPVGLYPITRS